MDVVVILNCDRELMEIIAALHTIRRFPRHLNRR